MSKKQKEKEEKIEIATVSSLDTFLMVQLLTPLIDPELNQHPSDPSVIWGGPTNLIGLNGVAKSARIGSIGRRIGIRIHTVYAPTKQPEDFTGAFVPTANGIVIECVLPQARACINDGGGCIFIDEISDARPATQAALHSFVHDRRSGDHLLPPKTRMLLAMNPEEYATVGHGLSSGMANRMAHVYCPPPTRLQWRKWLRGQTENVIPIDAGEGLVIANWNTHWPSTVALADKFMEVSNDKILHNQPKPEDPSSGGAWTSPRTWHWFLCGRTAAKCLGVPAHVEFELAEAYLGEGTANVWNEWVVKQDLVSPENMLKGEWTIDKKRLDKLVLSMTAMVEYLRALNSENRASAVGLAAACWTQIDRVVSDGLADIAVQGARVMCHTDLAGDNTNPVVAKISGDVIFKLTQKGYDKLI